MNYIIVAPHADDEIIGCYELLERGVVARVLFPNDEILTEASDSSDHFMFGRSLFEDHDFYSGAYTYLFPDPIHETHPDHRKYGHLGEELLREGRPVIFYSVNMLAPYIHKVSAKESKLKCLNMLYPHKSSLWECDYKYFLFEGYTKWIVQWDD